MSETPFEDDGEFDETTEVAPEPTAEPDPVVVSPEPTAEAAAELEYDRDKFDYSQFETDADVVTGTGEVTPDMRVQAWRAGYGVIRYTDDGWRVVRR